MNDGQPTDGASYRVDCGGVDDYPHDPGIDNKRRYASDRFVGNLTSVSHRVDTRNVAHGWDTVAMLAVVLAGTLVMWSCVAMAAPVLTASGATLDDRIDYRYGALVQRNLDGTIYRDPRVVSAFRKIHPCPSTMKTTGACPGWSVNHPISLACGGVDAVYNMQWLPNDIKSCAGAHCIDRFERKIYALTPPIPDTANCVNEVVP